MQEPVQLPPEIWFKVIEGLGLLDVHRLGQVSRYLRRIASTESLWNARLINLCRDEDLFPPSFTGCEISGHRLKRAAFGPHLWSNFLSRNAIDFGTLTEDAWSRIEPPLPKSTSSLRDIFPTDHQRKLAHLVPGGRFLVVIREECTTQGIVEPVCIALYDLGLPGSPLLDQPRLVCAKNVALWERYEPQRLSTAIGFQDCPIRLAITSPDSSSGAAVVKVFSIRPGDADPTFEEIGMLLLSNVSDDYEWTTSIINDRYFLNGDAIYCLLWDYRRNEVTRLHLSTGPYARFYCLVDTPTPTLVGVITPGWASWTFPRFESVKDPNKPITPIVGQPVPPNSTGTGQPGVPSEAAYQYVSGPRTRCIVGTSFPTHFDLYYRQGHPRALRDENGTRVQAPRISIDTYAIAPMGSNVGDSGIISRPPTVIMANLSISKVSSLQFPEGIRAPGLGMLSANLDFLPDLGFCEFKWGGAHDAKTVACAFPLPSSHWIMQGGESGSGGDGEQEVATVKVIPFRAHRCNAYSACTASGRFLRDWVVEDYLW